MSNNPDETESHQHKSPQCKTPEAGAICHEQVCLHDHHVSRHIEVSCTPAEGQSELFNCVHSASSST